MNDSKKPRFSASLEAKWRTAGLIQAAIDNGWDLSEHSYTPQQADRVLEELKKLIKRLERGYTV